MSKDYHHLTYDQRCQISILKDRGDSFRNIAKALNIHHTTVSREYKRNAGQRGYRHKQAQEKATDRKAISQNKKMTPEKIDIIEGKLKMQWSPVQISGWLKREKLEQVSHETIYKHVWTDKKKGGSLYKELRHRGKKYNKRSKKTAGRGCISNRVDIDKRPPIVEEKTRLGDWELDLIVGAGQSGVIVSMVDRASKLTFLTKLSRKTAEEVGRAIISALWPIREFVITLTAENGKEFACHELISAALEADFYFAKPYHSWERGLNEHTNGLARQYFPKKKRFDKLSVEDVKKCEALLNGRPRKILLFETPLKAFKRLAALTQLEPVTFESQLSS